MLACHEASELKRPVVPHLKAFRGAVGELQLLVQDADGVHNLGLPHACPGPLSCVHLPQHHSKGIHIHSLTQTACGS